MNPSFPTKHVVRLIHDKLEASDMDDSGFLDYARSCARSPCGAVLLSGGLLPRDGESRYSMAAWDPFAVFTSKGSSCTVRTSQGQLSIEGNPLSILDEWMSCFHPDFPLTGAPFAGGAVGYFAYDLKNSIERLPQTALDDLHLPDIFLFLPRQILIHDRIEGSLRSLTLGSDKLDGAPVGMLSPAPELPSLPEGPNQPIPLRVGKLRSNFSHEAYLEAVRRIRRYIREGDVYQVNLSQRYEFPFQGDAFHLWQSLFSLNPAPFYAFIQAGDHQVLSTSMERFLVRRNEVIETRPIKGTRKRGQTPEEDEVLARELQESFKDDAELSMIVDLLRNDLGRVCVPRSIRVAEHKRLETYQNVHHLVSIVTGILSPGTTCGQLLAATFPGGSITGCPKIRAMEIIDELESCVRHIYTGAIGYVGWHENLDLNVAIRTALIHGDRCCFSVGGGVVHDSTEEDEYQETLHKGRTLFQLIEEIGAKES